MNKRRAMNKRIPLAPGLYKAGQFLHIVRIFSGHENETFQFRDGETFEIPDARDTRFEISYNPKIGYDPPRFSPTQIVKFSELLSVYPTAGNWLYFEDDNGNLYHRQKKNYWLGTIDDCDNGIGELFDAWTGYAVRCDFDK